MRAIISFDEAAHLVEDEESILKTDSESNISEDDDPSFINHDSDWVSVFGNGKSLNCIFLATFNKLFYFCRNQARNLLMTLRKNQKTKLYLHFSRKE